METQFPVVADWGRLTIHQLPSGVTFLEEETNESTVTARHRGLANHLQLWAVSNWKTAPVVVPVCCALTPPVIPVYGFTIAFASDVSLIGRKPGKINVQPAFISADNLDLTRLANDVQNSNSSVGFLTSFSFSYDDGTVFTSAVIARNKYLSCQRYSCSATSKLPNIYQMCLFSFERENHRCLTGGLTITDISLPSAVARHCVVYRSVASL